MKKIAFFDFDGTITTKDTMIELIRFSKGSGKLTIGLLLLSPFIVGMKLNLISNRRAKEILLSYFFKGMDEVDFNRLCQKFSEEKLPGIIRGKMKDRIKGFRKSGVDVVIVTASASQWVKYWARQNNCSLISSELEVKNGKITGRLVGENCNFGEKSRRIKVQFNLSDYSDIYVYGDSSGDKEMLKLATHPFYRKFD
ncbi:MAG: haloacid dehalogenase-like hydrolase [Chitinophagaceae bacterium]|nr:haloacid dehalogenase-like hydrolase [Chitinophagaceae bacterium]